MTQPALAGLKVVECGDYIAAAYCAKLLADLGAEVTKIERPGVGDSARQHGPFPGDVPHPEKSGLFLYLNTNKRGITLNLEKATGQQILKELLKDADVFVENNPPALMEAWGLDYPSLKGLSPRLITTSITPYGQTGPYRDRPGYDLTCLALSGGLMAIGQPGREPLNVPYDQVSYQAAVSAVGATLVALLVREGTGQGQQVDVAAADVMANYVGQVSMMYIYHGLRYYRDGHRAFGSGGAYPYTILPCKDGYVLLICRSGHEWKRFVEAMGNPQWSQEPRYRDRRAMGQQFPAEVDALIVPWLRERTKEEILALCREKHIPFAPVRNIEEVVHEPHFRARGFLVAVEHPEAGIVEHPGAPYKLSTMPWAIRRPAPLLGQHNEEIYCGRLGYSQEQLAELYRTGVI